MTPEAESGTTSGTVDVAPTRMIDVEPPTPPAPAADEQKAEKPDAPDETAKPEEETTEQQEAKKQSKFQRRLERQKTARIQAETRAQIAEERLAKLEAQAKAPSGTDEPKREGYESYEEFIEARAEWKAEQKVNAALAERDKASQSKEQQERANAKRDEVTKSWEERDTAYEKAHPGYADRVSAFLEEDIESFAPVARSAMVELGPEVVDYLASHPDVAEQIAEMSPLRQVAALGKLEAAPVPKKSTNAPPPINPISQGKNASAGYRDDMPQDAYMAMRKKQGARWAR